MLRDTPMWHEFVRQVHQINPLLKGIITEPRKVYFQAIPEYFEEHGRPVIVKSMMAALGLKGDWDFVHEEIRDTSLLRVLVDEQEDYCDNVFLLNWKFLTSEPVRLHGKAYIDFIKNYEQEYGDFFFDEFGVILLVELKKLIVLDKKGYCFTITPDS